MPELDVANMPVVYDGVSLPSKSFQLKQVRGIAKNISRHAVPCKKKYGKIRHSSKYMLSSCCGFVCVYLSFVMFLSLCFLLGHFV